MGLNHLQSQVRVMVADDHATVRQGLCTLLKQLTDIQVVGETANGEEAVAIAYSWMSFSWISPCRDRFAKGPVTNQ